MLEKFMTDWFSAVSWVAVKERKDRSDFVQSFHKRHLDEESLKMDD